MTIRCAAIRLFFSVLLSVSPAVRSAEGEACGKDFRALTPLDLRLRELAHLQLNRIQDESLPSSTRAELQREFDLKIATAVAETLAAGNRGGDLELWAVGGDPKAPLRKFGGHRAAVISLAFNPDGKVLVSGAADGTVRVWEVGSDEREPLQELAGHSKEVSSIAFHPNGESFASGSFDRSVRVWGKLHEEDLR